MPFRAELCYTRQDMKQFDKVHQMLRYGVWYSICNLLLVLGCIAVLGSAVLSLVLGTWHEEWYYLIFVVLMLALLIAMKVLRVNASYKSANAQGIVTLTVDERGLHAAAVTLSTDFGFDKGHVFILPERCFTQGDPAAFGRFMAEKTGLTVKEIN